MFRITPSLTIHFQVSAKVTCDSIFLKEKYVPLTQAFHSHSHFSLYILTLKILFKSYKNLISATHFSASLSFYFTYFATIQICIRKKEQNSVVPMMSGVLLWVNCGTKENAIPLMGLGGRGVRIQKRFRHCSGISFSSFSSAVVEPTRSSEERVYEVVLKQAALVKEQRRIVKKRGLNLDTKPIEGDFTNGDLLSSAYDRCGDVCAEYAKTFYLGTQLMTEERRKAIWAIYVWCRRTDELVDGPNASHITPKALDRWEQRLTDVFEGRPYDMYDAALSDTVTKYPVDIQPFKDMIEGMRLDLRKSRYNNFDELYLYCYYVAGTVGLMSVPVMGIAPQSKASTESIYNAALALGIANQLTNILRDVGEDARRGRVYLPQDELAKAGLCDDDIFRGRVTDKWRNFMKGQIKRARMFFDEAEKGVSELSSASRWPVWASLLLYRQILDSIEANDYNNFTKRAYVGKAKKLLSLPVAFGIAFFGPQKLTKMTTR